MQAADKSDAIVIAVERDGKTYLNVTQMQPEDLPQKVKDLLSGRMDKTVFIKADARAKYERVVEVVDNLRAAGVDNVGLLTEQIQEKTTGAPGGTPATAPAGQ
jgi:biopolymer transport protein ExbD